MAEITRALIAPIVRVGVDLAKNVIRNWLREGQRYETAPYVP